jgi:hypothetical protein
MGGSDIRGLSSGSSNFPDFAALNPGYYKLARQTSSAVITGNDLLTRFNPTTEATASYRCDTRRIESGRYPHTRHGLKSYPVARR